MYFITTIKTSEMKLILLTILLIVSEISLLAQNSTSSPYSGFGIGELEIASGGRNAGMGQTGIALRSSLFLNTANPASLTNIESQGFMLDMGIYFKYTKLENTSKSVNVNDGNLSWLQIGFPITKKLFGGFTLNPKSSVGYNIYTSKTIDGTSISYPSVFEGTGGLSEAAGLLAWKVSKNISLGAKSGIIWGNVTQTQNQEISVSSTDYTMTQEDNIHYLGGYFNLGTQIGIPINAKSSFVLGGVAGISSRLNSNTSTTITRTYGSTSDIISSDVKSANSMRLPLDVGVGISYLYKSRWVATVDVKQSNWKDAKINYNPSKLTINKSFRGGLEFSPKEDTRTLLQTAKYRIGYRYETGYLKIFNNQIHEQAFSFGVGIPIRKDRSFANFSVELGTRGTTAAHLVKEDFIKLNCSFNLWDRWFIKRQFE
jgi:hypothetical protein